MVHIDLQVLWMLSEKADRKLFEERIELLLVAVMAVICKELEMWPNSKQSLGWFVVANELMS